jgi:hypothetical protein
MQFEDAEETSPASAALPAAPLAPSADLTAPRQVPGTFLDDDIDEEDEEDDDLWDEEDEAEWASERGLSAGINELMDQDWADASGGKQTPGRKTMGAKEGQLADRSTMLLQTSPNDTTECDSTS